MEAVPKLPMISFELKVSPEMTHFGPKLKQYISEAYRENPDSYSNEMHQLESLRSTAIRPASDTSGLSALKKYFCQLRTMQSRFPMAKGQPASVNFVWKDIYANMNCASADIRFEMACILYNIGALHTQLGSSEPRSTTDSLKAACTHYQQAAWAFQYLKEHYPQPPGVDVSPDIIRLLQEICFAQAQECILDKSIQDTKKSSVVGAVATQVMLFYKNSLAILGPSTGTDNIHEIIGTKLYNYWHRYLSFKNSYIGCIVALYQGMNAEDQQKMGERVAFYQLAIDKLADARKLAKYIEPVQVTQEALTFTNDVVEGKRKAAKNENEFIYHEEVLNKDSLSDLKPVCLVKGIAIEFDNPEISGPDIFSRLIPMGAHEAASLYSEEKATLLRQIVNQVEAKNTELTEFMSSLQLDQLDVLDSEQKIPQEIVDRCAAMNAKTDIIQALVDSMNNLAEVISDVESTLAECKSLIQEETAKEKEYQKSMGPRPPSIVQTELSRELHKYQEAHARTTESNQVLHKAMTLHIANLRLLALPLDQLEAKIPSIDNIEGLDRNSMQDMRVVVGKAREMQTQRDNLVQELRAALTDDDVTGALLARVSQTAAQIFATEIEKHKPKVKIIEQNLAAQENIINRLTSLYASYGESRRLLSDVLRKRESLINALITSYDTHEELLLKSQKGMEFYKKLLSGASQLQARLRATCQVQAEERAQLLANHATKAGAKSVVAPKSEVAAPTSEGYTPKLKDYLPYMKNRMGRNIMPQVQPDHLPNEAYYPESIYPTSVRPTPVGSEATTDAPQLKYPDGYVAPTQNPNIYNPYANQYTPNENNPYATPNNYAYPVPNKNNLYDTPKASESENYGYSTPYTPPQYANQMPNLNLQTYNPYYTATQDSTTIVSDSQNPQYNPGNAGQMHMNTNTSQYNTYNDQYAATSTMQGSHTGSIPEAVSSMSYSTGNNSELSTNFSQMQVSVPKLEPKFENPSPHAAEYSQAYYSANYPQVATPNMATYSHAVQNSNTNLVPSQIPAGYNALNYPYGSTDQTVPTSQNFAGNPVSNAYCVPDPAYNFASTSGIDNSSQGYPIYTNADTSSLYSATSASSNIVPASEPQPYTFPEADKINPAILANLDAFDKPIKSHVTGEALSTLYQPSVQTYDSNVVTSISGFTNPTEQNIPQANNQSYNVNYMQTYQSHPGYHYNAATGGFDYNYGSQKSFSSSNSVQGSLDSQSLSKEASWAAQGVYTSAGGCETLQSPSENRQMVPQGSEAGQIYFNSPYGYQTAMHPNEVVSQCQSLSTNYGANMNQSTYMQSGHGQNTSVTFSNDQVSTPQGNVPVTPNFNQYSAQNYQSPDNLQNPSVNYNTDDSQTLSGYYQNTNSINEKVSDSYQNPSMNYHHQSGNNQNQSGNNPNQSGNNQHQSGNQQDQSGNSNQCGNNQNQPTTHQIVANNYENPPVDEINVKPALPVETKEIIEEVSEPSTFDLLSDIDFAVDLPPLTPQIKVPQISENAIKKPIYTPVEDVPKPVQKVEETIMRPAKRDLFSDPGLLNKFTEEVKCLQRLVDSLSSKIAGGLTLLDSKWKTFQDVQTKENMTRTKRVAMQHTTGNIVTEVVPYDDSRLKIKCDPNAYINASYYKQLTPWCIPLVLSNLPEPQEYKTFWRAVLEYKMSCIVCLLTEMEMQGKAYWPTAKGQALELEDVKVTLKEVSCTVHWTERTLTVTDGKTSINVTHYQINVYPTKIVCGPLVLLVSAVLTASGEAGAWLQAGVGAGRGAVLAAVTALVCQVRAGQIALCETLDSIFVNLYKHRRNVLEDPKYLADAYRTALFYVQGVLCSGTTAFNGESVSLGSSSLMAPVPASSAKERGAARFSRESFEEMKQAPGLTAPDMKDPLNFLDPLWSLKKK